MDVRMDELYVWFIDVIFEWLGSYISTFSVSVHESRRIYLVDRATHENKVQKLQA